MALHGTLASYCDGCRCQGCKEAMAAYQHKRRAKRRELAAQDPSLIPHGTNNGYCNWSCRCPDCLAAHKAVNARYKK